MARLAPMCRGSSDVIVPPSRKSCGVETRGKDKPLVFRRRRCANWKLYLIQYLRALVLPLGRVRLYLFVRRSISRRRRRRSRRRLDATEAVVEGSLSSSSSAWLRCGAGGCLRAGGSRKTRFGARSGRRKSQPLFIYSQVSRDYAALALNGGLFACSSSSTGVRSSPPTAIPELIAASTPPLFWQSC